MYPWCYAFSIYSGNKDHFEGTYHLYFNIFGIKLEGHFYKHIPPNLIFSYSYCQKINKLCAHVCVLVPHKQLPPQNNVTGISLLDINSRSLSQFCLNFLLLGLESLVSAISVQCSTLAYCVCHHYSSLSLVNYLGY